MDMINWLSVVLVCVSARLVCGEVGSGDALIGCSGMVDVAVEELVVNGNLCLDVTGFMLPEVVCVTLTHAGSGRSKSFNYTSDNRRKCVTLDPTLKEGVHDFNITVTDVDSALNCTYSTQLNFTFTGSTPTSATTVPDSTLSNEFIVAISFVSAAIVVLAFLVCCLSSCLCWLRRARGRDPKHKEPRVVRWTDTEQGNVELLAMKTLSETRLEGGPLVTGPVEEGKKESVDGGGRKELGALTANTFGFQGEVVKNEEIPSTFTVTMATPDKQAVREQSKQPASSEPADAAPPTFSTEATPTTMDVPPSSDPPPMASTSVTSTDKSSSADSPPTSGDSEAKCRPPTDANLAADAPTSPDKTSKSPSETVGTVTSPKVTFSSDIEQIFGADFKLDTPGTPL